MKFTESDVDWQYAHGMTATELSKVRAENSQLRAALLKAKIGHYGCEDRWYSCPKHQDGCANDADGTDCNCGADQHNTEIDAALSGKRTVDKR